MKRIFRLSLSLVFLATGIVFCVLLPKISAKSQLREALYYEKLDNQSVQCQLCPRRCVIPKGRRGFCGVRENINGTLYTLVYAKPVAINIDPIEKKPLFHFLPGTTAFSVATAGCNMRCKFCQNWQISQRKPEEVEYAYLEPSDLIQKLRESNSPTIAYTYTEPTVFYEYILETAKLAKGAGFKNIMHSAGYINPAPLRQLAKYLDAANIDLKGFSHDYYANMSEATLEPVLDTLRILKEEGVHLEITNLIVSGYNDDVETIIKMCLWIKENLGADTPLHFSRFYPSYKLLAVNSTPVVTLEKARQIALDCGLKYVYIGNVPGHPAEHTYCPRCKRILIRRVGYTVLENNIEQGKCKFCQERLEGVWQ
ncbi:MAG: AmmeMemoRadiSam system radical SAM enzyme [Candidatus Omnitrophica bacterium]|nr:AmmeMemoRadiSam system radical SAM enzyme [Candidatus Omnitrophota bacterium]